MKRNVWITACLLALLAFAPNSWAATLCSWNIKNLGWGDNKHYAALGHVGDHCDWIAVQEVMSDEGRDRLLRSLRRHDPAWRVQSSHAIGRGSYKELYAFYYREGEVDYVDGALVFLDRDDRFSREPFSARFRTRDGVTFIGATVHVLYGDSVADRVPEIRTLSGYWQYLEEVYGGDEIVLAGDFNLPPEHAAYRPLREHAKALVTSGATTLSSIDKRYANLYDNLWVARDSRLPVSKRGIIPFPRLLKNRAGNPVTHKWARKHVSDHAPVFLTLGDTTLSPRAMTVGKAGGGPQRQGSTGRGEPGAQSRSEPASRNAEAPGAAVRGNRNSKIYHRPDCPSFGHVGERNRVAFDSAEAARSAGYREAGNCP